MSEGLLKVNRHFHADYIRAEPNDVILFAFAGETGLRAGIVLDVDSDGVAYSWRDIFDGETVRSTPDLTQAMIARYPGEVFDSSAAIAALAKRSARTFRSKETAARFLQRFRGVR